MLPVFVCILTPSLVGDIKAQVKDMVPLDLSLVYGTACTLLFEPWFSPLCMVQVLLKVPLFCPTQIT